MNALHPIEERLRQRWGELTTVLVHAPAGRLWQLSATPPPDPNSASTAADPAHAVHAAPSPPGGAGNTPNTNNTNDTNDGASLIAIIIPISASITRVTECLSRFAENGALLRNDTAFLWPDRALPDPSLPALRYALSGPRAVPLPVFLAQDHKWSLRRLCGQLMPLLSGLQNLHTANKVHGAVSPLSIVCEQLGSEHVLRWMYTGLWSPLRELGISNADALGAGAPSGAAITLPNQAQDIRQFGHVLAWLKASTLPQKKTSDRWPAALDNLIVRCTSSTPPPCSQVLSALQDTLAAWDTLPESPLPLPADPSFSPRTGASPAIQVALPSLGDPIPQDDDAEPSAPSSQPDQADAPPLQPASSSQSVAVRLPKYVGQSTAEPPSTTPRDDSPTPGERDPASRTQPMRSPEDLGTPPQASTPDPSEAPPSDPDKEDKESKNKEDEEEPTTMVLSRDRLSGMFAALEQQKEQQAQKEQQEQQAQQAQKEPKSPPPPAPPAPASKPKRARRRKVSNRSSIEPENQVILVKHDFSQRSGLASQPAFLILVVLLVLAIVLLVLLLLKPAEAQSLSGSATSHASDVSPADGGRLRLALASRSGTRVLLAAVNPAAPNYATCAGHDVTFWATQAPPQTPLPLLDRFTLGSEPCAQMTFSSDGLALFVLTTGGSILRYDIAAARLDALKPPLEQVFFYDLQALGADEVVLVGEVHAQHRAWHWHIQSTSEPTLLLQSDHPLQRCDANSARAAAFQDAQKVHLFFWPDAALSRALTLPDQAQGCALSADGQRLSVLVSGVGVQHWSLPHATSAVTFPEWPQAQSARVGSLLRYGGRSDLLLWATRDRISSLDPAFARVAAALAIPQFSTLQGHQAWPLPDQDAALLLSDGKARVISLSTGESRGEAAYQLPWVHQASAFSPDGAHVISLFSELGDAPLDRPGPSSILAVWSLNTYALTARQHCESWVRRLSLTPRGDALAVVVEHLEDQTLHAGGDEALFSLHLWPLPDVANATSAPFPLRSLPAHLQWSSDGRYALLRTESREHLLLHRDAGDNLTEIPIQIEVSESAALYQDHALIIWSPTGGLRVVDLYSNRSSETLLKPSDLDAELSVYDVVVHPSSRGVVLTGRGGGVWVALPSADEQRARLRSLPSEGRGEAAFDASGQRFVLSGVVYDSTTGLPLVRLDQPKAPQSLFFSPDGRWLWRSDLKPGRWNATTGAFDPGVPPLWASQAQNLWGGQLGAAHHPASPWALRQTAGLAKLEAEDGAQSVEFGLLGADGWAIVHDDAFASNITGRAFISLSDGSRALPLGGAQEGAEALTSALGAPLWEAAPKGSLASWAVNYLVRLELITTPPGVEVLLDDGKGALKPLGVTPLTQSIPGPTADSLLVFRKEGYTTSTFPWLPGEDLVLNLELRSVLTEQESAFVQVVSGPLLSEELLAVVQRNREQLKNCLSSAAATPAPCDAQLEIASGGEVSEVSFASGLTDVALTQCLRYAIMRWRLPARPLGSVVRYRFLLDQYMLP